MDNRVRYFEDIPSAAGWVDGFVFLALCVWALAVLQHFNLPKREGSFFSSRRRFCTAATLFGGVAFHIILLGGLNLFSLFQKSTLFALLGGCWLVMAFSECLVLAEIRPRTRRRHLSHLLYGTFSAIVGMLLFHLRQETLGTRLYDNWQLISLASLLLLSATAIAWHHASDRARPQREATTRLRSGALLAVALLLFGLCWLWLETASQRTMATFRARMLSIASLGASTLPASSVLRLRGLPEDYPTANYQATAAALHHITTVFPVVQNAYLWTARGSDLLFVADGSQANLSPPGEVFRALTDPLGNTPYVLHPFYDPWGFWIAANHPILDPATHEPFCWLGLDIPASSYYLALGEARLQVMSFTALFLLALGIYHGQRRQMAISLEFERERQTIREKERQTLAGYLHDDLGQILTSFRLELAGADSLQHDAIARLKNLLDVAGCRNRGAAFALAPYQSNLAQFSKELTHFIQECALLLGLRVSLELPPEPFACASFDIAENIIRILQESLTNVARHSHRASAVITVQQRKNAWHLTVENDPRPPGSPGESEEDRPRLGLRLMEERVRQMGGQFTFMHLTGGQARLECQLPATVFSHPDPLKR